MAWLTADDAAAQLGVSRKYVYTLVTRGLLTARRTGRAVEISSKSVERRKETNPGPGQPRKKTK